MNIKKQAVMFFAVITLRFYRLKSKVEQLLSKHANKSFILFLLGAIIISAFVCPQLQRMTKGYFNNTESLGALRSLLASTGTALIGAAAIAFSIVVFAMQINIERMPHGLFRRLSSDKRLLGAFLGSFIIALLVAATSMIPNGNFSIAAIITAFWGIIMIMLLFLYAYRRALRLINPIEQLIILSDSVRRDLSKWNRRAEIFVILFNKELQQNSKPGNIENNFNSAKSRFFQANAGWSKSAEQAIHYANSYAKRFADQGDYEVTQNAVECIMLVNAKYCSTKYGTFVGSNLFLTNTDTTDGFINTSLELYRQMMQTALAKGDERLASCTLRGIISLYGIYLMIEYPRRGESKYHALLAARYLGSAVESIISHNMIDLMMEGIRLLGKASKLALDHTQPNAIIYMAEKIAILSAAGVINVNYQPLTLIAFEQLADITYELILKGKNDIQHPVSKLREDVTEATKRFLETSDTSLSSIHRTTLGPYFSSTSISSLPGRLKSLANQLIQETKDHERAGEVIQNIATWARKVYYQHKELLLLAVKKRSSFTFDVISWTIDISDILNVISNAPHCTQHLKEELRNDANNLIMTLSWLPDDRESVIFVENNTLTESLFEAAIKGFEHDCPEFYKHCKGLLMDWACKGGMHETGWGILEKAVKGLAVLAINEGTSDATTELKTLLRDMLKRDKAPPMELRTSAAARLARSAKELRHNATRHSLIEYSLSKLDNGAVRTLINELAEIIASDLHPIKG